MKKSIFLMAGLIGFAMTSCDDKSDLGTMQKNEAPVVVPADGVALQSIYAPQGNRISLANYTETADVPLVDIEISKDFPASATVTGSVEIADNADFTNAQTIALSSTEAASANQTLASKITGETRSLTGYVDVNEWEAAFESFYGLNPNPNINYLRYRLWLTNGDQKVILYNNDGTEWFDAMEFTVTPIDANLDVAPAYNLVYEVGGKYTTVEMYHNPANHQYDDPVFNAMVEVSEEDALAGFNWTIAPADNPSEVFGVQGTNPAATSGLLGFVEDGAIAGQIAEAGSYKIEANMLTRSFKVQVAPASLYVVSTSNISFPQAAQLATEDYITYKGLAGIESAWGLTGQAAYKPTLYVNNPDVATTVNGGTTTGGLLYDTSGAPLNSTSAIPLAGQRGMFYVTANLQTLTYTLYRCNTIGITGSMTNWGETPDVALSNSRTTYYMQWSGKLTVNAGDEWKIRANSDWAVNFGGANGSNYATDGSAVELSMDGANLVAAESGTYNVTVYFRRTLENGVMTPYYMTVTPAN